MTETLFPDFPDDTRLWIYVADREIGHDDWRRLETEMGPFLERWTSHRRDVRGAVELLYGRFVMLAAHVPDGDISGCGIDKSVHEIESLAGRHAFSWLPTLDIVWSDGTAIRTSTRSDFRSAVLVGSIRPETTVFDRSLASLAALRSGHFERPAGDSWLTRVFRIPRPKPAGA